MSLYELYEFQFYSYPTPISLLVSQPRACLLDEEPCNQKVKKLKQASPAAEVSSEH